MGLAPWGRFRPSSGVFFRPFRGSASFVDLLFLFCLVFVVSLCASVCVCFVVAVRGGWPLGSRLWCLLWVCHFSIGILGQVLY